jgi:hypothetical protein
MSDVTDPYWTIADLIDRVYSHDWMVQTWEILVIVHTLAEEGRVRTIGRRCDDADRPLDEWNRIPAHQFADLRVDLPPRGQPHPGDLFWRSSGRRAWAFAQFSERDLMREWLAAVFGEPKPELPADIMIPPKRSDPPTTVEAMPAAEGERASKTNQQSKPSFQQDVQTLFNAMIAEASPLPDATTLNQWVKEHGLAVRRMRVLRRNCPDERLHKRGRRSTNPE